MLVAAFAPGVVAIIVVASLGLSIWALVDALSRPAWAFRASGNNKTLWVVLEAVGLVVCGLILSLVYLIAIRPRVAAAQRDTTPPVGASPPGWYPDPSGAEQYRYWDGRAWTTQTRPMM